MTIEPAIPDSLVYRVGLDPVEEAVISSHFMHGFCNDARLELYSDVSFRQKSLTIPAEVVDSILLPALLRAARTFASDRADVAKRQAAKNWRYYSVDPSELSLAEYITEVMFDRQFRSGSRETCTRQDIREKVARCISAAAPIEMAIVALPYKFSCPLKTRGQSPDLAEVNFILSLYEIVTTIEILYREARPNLPLPLARFTVISDGSRFNTLTNEPASRVESYQHELARWIGRMGLEKYIELVDYKVLLRDRLPERSQKAKAMLRERALIYYADVMWAIFDPCNMIATLQTAARVDPDPEARNQQGRFSSLFKSLVFTVRYQILDPFRSLPADQFRMLYRELIGHIFEPFTSLSAADWGHCAEENSYHLPVSKTVKEYLRQAMLREVWHATIAYIAEIKSDREQPSDPVSSCLYNHVRWTIHAKPGQLGLLTPSTLGKPVLPWAGAAVFKRAKGGGVRLCTLPVLALEGVGAIPVASDYVERLDRAGQPLFYIYPDVSFGGFDDFLSDLPSQLVRKRAT